jgi:hypothetical protein
MKRIKYAIATAFIALTACGGGGGGGGTDSDKSVFGTWKGDLFLVNRTDNCQLNTPDSISRTIIVEEPRQGDKGVVVSILGEEVDGRGVIKGGTLTTSFSNPLPSLRRRIIVTDLTPLGDGTADFDYTVTLEPLTSRKCTFKYRGQLTRG